MKKLFVFIITVFLFVFNIYSQYSEFVPIERKEQFKDSVVHDKVVIFQSSIHGDSIISVDTLFLYDDNGDPLVLCWNDTCVYVNDLLSSDAFGLAGYVQFSDGNGVLKGEGSFVYDSVLNKLITISVQVDTLFFDDGTNYMRLHTNGHVLVNSPTGFDFLYDVTLQNNRLNFGNSSYYIYKNSDSLNYYRNGTVFDLLTGIDKAGAVDTVSIHPFDSLTIVKANIDSLGKDLYTNGNNINVETGDLLNVDNTNIQLIDSSTTPYIVFKRYENSGGWYYWGYDSYYTNDVISLKNGLDGSKHKEFTVNSFSGDTTYLGNKYSGGAQNMIYQSFGRDGIKFLNKYTFHSSDNKILMEIDTSGYLDMHNHKITNVANGTSNQDAVNKYQLDTTYARSFGGITRADAIDTVGIHLFDSLTAGKFINNGQTVNGIGYFDSNGKITTNTNFTWNDTSIHVEFGTNNLFITDNNPSSFTGGGSNVIIGNSNAGSSLTTCNSNTGIGNAVFENLTSGQNNVCIGDGNGSNLVDGDANVTIGISSFDANTNGNNNTALGSYTLGNATTGSGNIAIGAFSGRFQTNLSNRFYVNNNLHTNLQEDTTMSLIYGIMDTDTLNQKLRFAADVTISNDLTVNGTIYCDSIFTVKSGVYADYVFKDDFKLPKFNDYLNKSYELKKLASFENKDRQNLIDYVTGLEESLEMLYLYVNEQQKEIEKLKKRRWLFNRKSIVTNEPKKNR